MSNRQFSKSGFDRNAISVHCQIAQWRRIRVLFEQHVNNASLRCSDSSIFREKALFSVRFCASSNKGVRLSMESEHWNFVLGMLAVHICTGLLLAPKALCSMCCEQCLIRFPNRFRWGGSVVRNYNRLEVAIILAWVCLSKAFLETVLLLQTEGHSLADRLAILHHAEENHAGVRIEEHEQEHGGDDE